MRSLIRCGAIFALGCLSSAAVARVIHVGPAGSACAGNLQQAINSAQDNDLIALAPGHYSTVDDSMFPPQSTLQINTSQAPHLRIFGNLSCDSTTDPQDPDAQPIATFIDANAATAIEIVGNAPNGDLQFADLQISGATAANAYGVTNSSTTPVTMSRVQISGNQTGIHLISGSLTLRDRLVIRDNNQTQVSGGGISGGINVSGGALIIRDGVSLFNNSTVSDGGALFVNAGRVEITSAGYVDPVTHARLPAIGNNSAVRGGGIAVNSGTVVVKDLTLISGNSATSGGGVKVIAPGKFALLGHSAIAFNSALSGGNVRNSEFGLGGGLYVTGRADIGASGFHNPDNTQFLGAVSSNFADVGGAGIAVADGGTARAFRVDADVPVQIDGNGFLSDGPNGTPGTRTPNGGAVLITTVFGGSGAFCGWGYSMNFNHAGNGAAIYADAVNASAQLSKQEALHQCGDDATDPSLFSSPAVECTIGSACNQISNNTADGGGDSIVRLFDQGSSLSAGQLIMTNNSGSLAVNSAGTVVLISSVVADNQLSRGVPLAAGHFTIDGSTLLNQNSSDPVVNAALSLNLTRSIVVGEVGLPSPLATDIEDVVTSSTVLPGSNLLRGVSDFGFVDQPHDNFHLLPTSIAIDLSALGGFAGDVDLDGAMRGTNVLHKPNGARFDAGAYEFAPIDHIFINGFEVTPPPPHRD
jgi:hypothetical protein